MAKKRPCSICRKWFQPHPRSAERQRTCGSPGCQRERHRRSCAAARVAEHEAVVEDRLRGRLTPAEGVVDRRALRDALGTQVAVAIEEIVRVLVAGARDAFRTQQLEITEEFVRVLPRASRDAMVGVPP